MHSFPIFIDFDMGVSPNNLLVSVCLAFCLAGHVALGWDCTDITTRAVCNLQPNPSLPPSQIRGQITFEQLTNCINRYPNWGPLVVNVKITGLPRFGEPNYRAFRGFHVHQLGIMSRGCEMMGGHFNPHRTTHGSRMSSVYTRHVGDFGNVHVDNNGNVEARFTDRIAQLFGPNTIIGRGIVLHEGTDDLGLKGDAGSKLTGNAGKRIACCVIEPVH